MFISGLRLLTSYIQVFVYEGLAGRRGALVFQLSHPVVTSNCHIQLPSSGQQVLAACCDGHTLPSVRMEAPVHGVGVQSSVALCGVEYPF